MSEQIPPEDTENNQEKDSTMSSFFQTAQQFVTSHAQVFASKAADTARDFIHTNFLHEARRFSVQAHMSDIKPIHQPFALTHATLVDVSDAAHPKTEADQTIVVSAEGRIQLLGPSSQIDPGIPDDFKVLDAQGRYILAGLINAHVHTFADGRPSSLTKVLTLGSLTHEQVRQMHDSPLGQEAAERLSRINVQTMLASGVTTIRTLGDLTYDDVKLAQRVDSGKAAGPRILASGPMIAIPGGHGAPFVSVECATPEDVRAAVTAHLDAGCTAIKLAATGGVTDAKKIGNAGTPQLTVEQMEAACEEAHERGVLVAAHCQSTQGMLNALRAGVDTIEHGAALNDEALSLFQHNPKSLRGYSALNPTLLPALTLDRLPQSVTGINDIVKANTEAVTKGMIDVISQAHENNILVGLGTDSAMPLVTQYSTWHELDYRVRFAGETIGQALNAATAANARMLGLDKETGTLEVGKSADFIVLESNPLDRLSALDTPSMVVTAGTPIFRPSTLIRRFDDIDADLNSII
jgi:imidazolonepropionase-like amidohydrolase